MLKFALKRKEIGLVRWLKYYLKDLLHCRLRKWKFCGKFSNFYKGFLRVTYKIAKFPKYLIYLYVNFEPNCAKIDEVMSVLL